MVTSRSMKSLSNADARVETLMAQIAALTAKLDVVNEQRVDIIGEAALKAFPEIDAGEYGEDLILFFTEMREDALSWRAQLSQAKPEVAKSASKNSVSKDSVSVEELVADETSTVDIDS